MQKKLQNKVGNLKRNEAKIIVKEQFKRKNVNS